MGGTPCAVKSLAEILLLVGRIPSDILQLVLFLNAVLDEARSSFNRVYVFLACSLWSHHATSLTNSVHRSSLHLLSPTLSRFLLSSVMRLSLWFGVVLQRGLHCYKRREKLDNGDRGAVVVGSYHFLFFFRFFVSAHQLATRCTILRARSSSV